MLGCFFSNRHKAGRKRSFERMVFFITLSPRTPFRGQFFHHAIINNRSRHKAGMTVKKIYLCPLDIILEKTIFVLTNRPYRLVA